MQKMNFSRKPSCSVHALFQEEPHLSQAPRLLVDGPWMVKTSTTRLFGAFSCALLMYVLFCISNHTWALDPSTILDQTPERMIAILMFEMFHSNRRAGLCANNYFALMCWNRALIQRYRCCFLSCLPIPFLTWDETRDIKKFHSIPNIGQIE